MGKREEQQKRKEAKQQAAKQREQTQRLMGKIGLFGITPLFVLLVLYTIYSQGPTYSPVEITATDHVRGQASNPVSIVVYADFQCPACAQEHRTMMRLWPQLRDMSHLVFRHFPLTAAHQHSWEASLYAEAAGKQGRFWEMHDLLFANQAVWSSLTSVENEFDSYALELNLDLEQLHADIESDEVIEKVRSDQRSGNSSGVRSTPTVFVNGRQLLRADADNITEEVNEAYAASSGD